MPIPTDAYVASTVTVSGPAVHAISSSGSVVQGRPWLSAPRREQTPIIAP
ncbi:hypothetical protein AB0D30_41010 [Streptomyces sp. NPDC048409]